MKTLGSSKLGLQGGPSICYAIIGKCSLFFIPLDSLVLNWFLHSLCHILNHEMGTGMDMHHKRRIFSYVWHTSREKHAKLLNPYQNAISATGKFNSKTQKIVLNLKWKKNQTSKIPESIYIWIGNQEGIERGWNLLGKWERKPEEKSVFYPSLSPLHPHQLIFPVGYKTVFPQNATQWIIFSNEDFIESWAHEDLLMENGRGGQTLWGWSYKWSWTARCGCWESNWGPLQ